MATLVKRTRGITGSTTAQTSNNNVVGFIQSAVQYAIAGIPKELQWIFSSAGADITNGNGQRPASDTILSVTRNNIECTEIPMSYAYAQEAAFSPTSFNAGTTIFPVRYTKEGLVFIKPDPAAGAVGTITSVAIPTIALATTDTWSFKVLDQVIINYACALDCKGLASYWRTNGIEDALTQAQNLIDNNTDVDFLSYMASSEEDDQQAQLTLQGASQEVSRAGRETEKVQLLLNKADKFFETAAFELQKYIENNSQTVRRKELKS